MEALACTSSVIAWDPASLRWAFRKRNEWAYTDRPAASRTCPRNRITRLACVLVPVAAVLGVLSVIVGVVPLLRRICHWTVEVCLLPSVPVRPVLLLLLLVAVVLWVLPGERNRPDPGGMIGTDRAKADG